MKKRINHLASYKDPSAKVFYLEEDDEHIYRQLHPDYFHHYRHLKNSGLAAELIKKNMLINFEEIDETNGSVILKAEKISFVSYPYEWTFNQWKDAALLTLKIQYQALKFGMTLKDATPFNIVFKGAKPVFIDISSFEIFAEKEWKAYKQFSENFYMPLLLHKYYGAFANHIYFGTPAGIALNKGLSMLPFSEKLNLNTLLFLSFPEKLRNHSAKKADNKKDVKNFNQKKSMALAERLFLNINKIDKVIKRTKWNAYYQKDVDENYLLEKKEIVETWFKNDYDEKSLIDFGCNTGNFSLLLSKQFKKIIAFDEDIYAADELYSKCHKNNIENIFSFSASISQPTPSTGWNNMEYASLTHRLKADVGLALALIHHLAITNYIRFDMMADFFAETCKELIIEFVPKEDKKVQLLLSSREDIFEWYTFASFSAAFEKEFSLIKKHTFKNQRTLLHFVKK